ncbi:hypothetical protein V6N11_056652 [Hibiscus sabdariffa]|uniref:Uncharacterized protein n=1 Tax=Hibiscus sabdariffa TaxID=183260 RepID=A0ABR2T4I2_9ROSI
MVKTVKAHADDAFMSCKILKNRSRLMYISFLGIVVRALVPRMNLDDLFEQKGKIAKAVLEELGKGLKYKKGRKSETDSEFNRYEGEDMVELDDDDHGSVDPSIRLTVASSTEMDLVRDSIRDQIVEHMKLN